MKSFLAGPDPDKVARQGLGSTIRRGAAVSAAALVFVQLVSLAQTLVLARILTPAEVGIFYGGTVLTGLLVLAAEGGIRNALVQRREDVEAAANTAFLAGLVAGLLWSLLALSASPLVAMVLSSREAGLVAAVSAAGPLLYAMTYVPDALMQRRFDFRQKIVVQPATTLSFAAVSVALALAGLGVWALVIASYTSQVVWIIASWSLARWRPRRGLASFAIWRQLMRFGAPLVLGSLLERGKESVDTAVVGALFSPTAMGHYRYGRRLGLLPSTVVINVASYVLLPAFSRAATDPARFGAAYRRALRVLWSAAMPIAALVLALGSAATVILLGEPWREAGKVFTALAGSGLGVAMAAVGHESIKASGRTSQLNVINITTFVVGVGTLLALAPLGLAGVGASLSIAALWSGGFSLVVAHRLAGVEARAHVELMLPPLIAGVITAAIWWVVEREVLHADDAGLGEGLLLLSGETVGLVATYLLVLVIVAPRALPRLRLALFPRGADEGR